VVDAYRLSRTHRQLRHRLRVTQRELSRASGVGRNKISEIENRDFTRITLSDLEGSFAAMGAVVHIRVDWHGAALDRLLDEGHAAMAAAVGRLLRKHRWDPQFEVTFARHGDRGSFDVLAWHAPSRSLLVIELKTELGSLEGTLRPLDAKARNAPAVARQRFGWDASAVGRVLVLPEGREARRAVTRHAGVLDAALPSRTVAVKRWLAAPEGAVAGLLFLATSQLVGLTRNPSAIRRVRSVKRRASAAQGLTSRAVAENYGRP
jgi:transcriptional regulator with XRE-family HTH domain